LAIAPFPIPAHQTGRADFRHPAFRLASPRGTRRGRSGQALEAQNAEFSMNDIECESAIAAPLHLVPSHEEPAHTFEDVLVDATICLAPRFRAAPGTPPVKYRRLSKFGTFTHKARRKTRPTSIHEM